MAFQRDSKLGYGYLLVGIAVPPLTDNIFGHTAGLIAYAICLLGGIIFLLVAHHDQLPQRRSLLMTIFIFALYGSVIGALGGGLTGAILRAKGEKKEETNKPTNNKTKDDTGANPDSATSPGSATPTVEPLTLHYLYKHDFDDTLRLTHPFSITESATGKVISFEAQLYQDFPARSKFLGVYFPRTSPEETFKDAALFAEFYQDFLKNLPESSSAFIGEEMMLSKDLKFSGRVFIYHEDLLTLEQRASLEKLYKSKELSVQFRGFSYLSGKILGESAPHDPAKPPSKPYPPKVREIKATVLANQMKGFKQVIFRVENDSKNELLAQQLVAALQLAELNAQKMGTIVDPPRFSFEGIKVECNEEPMDSDDVSGAAAKVLVHELRDENFIANQMPPRGPAKNFVRIVLGDN
jgi:hypothetical protein